MSCFRKLLTFRQISLPILSSSTFSASARTCSMSKSRSGNPRRGCLAPPEVDEPPRVATRQPCRRASTASRTRSCVVRPGRCRWSSRLRLRRAAAEDDFPSAHFGKNSTTYSPSKGPVSSTKEAVGSARAGCAARRLVSSAGEMARPRLPLRSRVSSVRLSFGTWSASTGTGRPSAPTVRPGVLPQPRR